MNHDGETTDTWAICPWCNEEYSQEAEPCLIAAKAENERLRKEIVRLFEVASGEQYESGNPAILAMVEIRRLRAALNPNLGEGKK